MKNSNTPTAEIADIAEQPVQGPVTQSQILKDFLGIGDINELLSRGLGGTYIVENPSNKVRFDLFTDGLIFDAQRTPERSPRK